MAQANSSRNSPYGMDGSASPDGESHGHRVRMSPRSGEISRAHSERHEPDTPTDTTDDSHHTSAQLLKALRKLIVGVICAGLAWLSGALVIAIAGRPGDKHILLSNVTK